MQSRSWPTLAMGKHFYFCCCSVSQSCPTLCDPMDCSIPGLASITNSWSLLKLMSIESGMSSIHRILCHPLLLLPLIFPSIRAFSSELAFLLYIPQNIYRYYVCFSTPFFFFFPFQVKRCPVLLAVLHRMWFPHSSSLLILLCTSSHPVPLGYDESFMSVVLRVHHGVLAVYFCHHWVQLCCHQEYQPGGGTG